MDKGVTKGVDKRTDEVVLRWFGHMERMEKERIVKRVSSMYESVLVLIQWIGRGRDGVIP